LFFFFNSLGDVVSGVQGIRKRLLDGFLEDVCLWQAENCWTFVRV